MVAFTTTLVSLSIATLAWGHAQVTSPPIRTPGDAHLTACGQTSFNEITNDPTGHIEDQEPVNQGCQPTLCRGMVFADVPAANVQKVAPGDSMAMKIDCTIPHGGPANVSLIDTTAGGTGQVIGGDLASFTDFCPTTGATPADQSNLQFNLPSANQVGNKCQKAGDCVVQLFWATPDATQNYYYCVDVAMGGATAGAGAGNANAGAGNANAGAGNANAGAGSASAGAGNANAGAGNAAAATGNANANAAGTAQTAKTNAAKRAFNSRINRKNLWI